VRHPALFLRKSARGDGRNGGHLFPALYKNAGIASHLPKGILSPVCPRRLDLLPRWFCACFSCFTAGMFSSFPEKRSASVYMVREERLHFIVQKQENSHTPFGTDPRIGCASSFARSSSERRGGQRPGSSLFLPSGHPSFCARPADGRQAFRILQGGNIARFLAQIGGADQAAGNFPALGSGKLGDEMDLFRQERFSQLFRDQ